jgi:hypothetical protein
MAAPGWARACTDNDCNLEALSKLIQRKAVVGQGKWLDHAQRRKELFSRNSATATQTFNGAGQITDALQKAAFDRTDYYARTDALRRQPSAQR